MTLEESINNDLADYIGKQCQYDGGIDTIEKVFVSGAAFGGYTIWANLEYSGRVPVTEVKLIKE